MPSEYHCAALETPSQTPQIQARAKIVAKMLALSTQTVVDDQPSLLRYPNHEGCVESAQLRADIRLYTRCRLDPSSLYPDAQAGHRGGK